MKTGLSFCAILFSVLPGAVVAAEIDFVSDVQPILEERCFECHGPDKQKGAFRLDRLASMLSGGDSGEAAIVRGKPDASFLLKLVRHEEPDLEMPPKGDPLSDSEISLLQKWISEGAKTPSSYGPAVEKVDLTHWSFVPVRRPESFGNIDGFIREKLTESGLEPSRAADRRILIRRLFLVMLGIPPTPDQVEAFVADSSPRAWEDLVEQVLASPRYGERWASHWLDLVRFGETNGFETNRERPNAWHFRDWVIESFNSDKPYDQFVREQIAGDAMGSDVGTAFLVAGPFDTVKGQDPKLRLVQRMNELDDMINATGTAFLGLTLGCARCHNHKFDPVTQKDYYSMQAIFAGVNHADRALPLPKKRQAKVAALDAEIDSLREQLEAFRRRSTDALVAIDDALADFLSEPKGKGINPAGEKPGFADDRGTDRRAPNVSGGEYTWWANTPGKEVAAWRPHLNGRYRIWLSWGAGHKTHTKDAHYFLQTQKAKRTLVARVNQQLPADGSVEVANQSLWSGFYNGGVHELQSGDSLILLGGQIGSAITADIVLFEAISDDNSAEKEPARPEIRKPISAAHNLDTVAPVEAKFVRFTIEASSSSSPACIDELEIFSGGKNVALARAGAKASSSGDFQHPLHKLAHINDGKYGNAHSWIVAGNAGWVQIELSEPAKIDRIEWARDREKKYTDRVPIRYRIEAATVLGEWCLLASSDDRLPMGAGEKDSAISYDFDSHPPAEAKKGRQRLARLDAAQKERELTARPVKVYAGTFSQPGVTHRLYRGEPDATREEVGPDAVTAFGSLNLERSAPEQQRRVALAEWITDPQNPLTARVIANRLWQFHFGTGIVDTPSDFGTNGTPPSHPALLDWMADELMANQWSLKHLHRLILSSQTWRQDSRPKTEAMGVDATSRLLWRFPTRRLEAEGIRDAILAASGALDLEKAGGPGFSAFEVEQENVRHYHPRESFGPGEWRRMIYMTKVRQEKDAVFGAFDCPDASMVVAKRSRSTTPLQALNLLNSTFVLQQAELLAGRLKSEAETDTARVERAWDLCFQRPPGEAEMTDAIAFIQQEGLVPFARAMLNANEFVFIP
ncbi:MAG: PSD1 and planctomycete cytochrome C domain-containing protein [Verrucomicrobiales bacterium]|nr:PSD1 and planctomycete cytochrome C domain-containing protein [Verrucomicrobiales bacterium]